LRGAIAKVQATRKAESVSKALAKLSFEGKKPTSGLVS
jgi:hypothetical protein